MTTKSFQKDFDDIGKICRSWWIDLAAIDEKTGKERRDGKPNRAALATLRQLGVDRSADDAEIDVAAANLQGSYRRLRGALSGYERRFIRGSIGDGQFDQAVAVVAATLARVRQESPDLRSQPVARRLGLGKDGKPVKDEDEAAARVMAEMRFKRLIRTRTWPDLLDQGRRIVALLDRDVPVADLGASLFLWNSGPGVVRSWSFAYYGVDERDDADATAA